MNMHLRQTLFFLGLSVLIVLAGYFTLRRPNTPPSDIQIKTSGKTVIQQIRSLNRLETASFTIEKVIDAGTSGGKFEQFLFGDRLLLIAHGEVIAGIDMAKLQDTDITMQDTAITVQLPAPQILTTTLDSDQTRVYDRQTGIFSKGNKDLESEARKAAEQTVREAACQGNILTIAGENAKKQLTALLRSLAFTTVTITVSPGSCN